MVFGLSTPESLLARSDSKNPATTCKGVTAKGQLCRKPLSASVTSSHRHQHDPEGVLAVLDSGNAAAFFCHHHEDQAELLVAKLRDRSTILPLNRRNSVDTLVERLGVLDVNEDQPAQQEYRQKMRNNGNVRSQIRRKDDLPREWRNIEGPLMVVPEDVLTSGSSRLKLPVQTRNRPSRHSVQPKPRSNVKASWSCCIRADDEDDPPPSRTRRPRTRAHSQALEPLPNDRIVHDARPSQQMTPVRRKPVSTPTSQVQSSRHSVEQNGHSPFLTPSRPQLKPQHSSTSPPNSQTMTFLSYIPPHLPPIITSSLLTELSRPISGADDDGYIYIYWLTPESDPSKPDDETASSLLDADDLTAYSPTAERKRRSSAVPKGQVGDNRVSQALKRYASVKRNPREPQKILLKIGRTSNVHRRLTEWTKQCGQNITLIRYYPYDSSGSSVSNHSPQLKRRRRTVPHVHRVERLIHLELADKRVTDNDECASCGRIHREWFEVEATRQGVREVDEVIRRWVNWAETQT